LKSQINPYSLRKSKHLLELLKQPTMNKILKTRKSSYSANEAWDGEFKSEAPKWTEKLIRQESVTDGDWEWAKVIPNLHKNQWA